MNEDENIVVFFLWFEKVLNAIQGLGEPMESEVVV